MSRWLMAAVVVVVLAGEAPTASGQFYDGNSLHEDCQARGDAALMEEASCLGYVAGIFDLLFVLNSGELGGAIVQFCYPKNGTQGQMRDVVKLWLETHPEKRHEYGAKLVVIALNEAFPCE